MCCMPHLQCCTDAHLYHLFHSYLSGLQHHPKMDPTSGSVRQVHYKCQEDVWISQKQLNKPLPVLMAGAYLLDKVEVRTNVSELPVRICAGTVVSTLK